MDAPEGLALFVRVPGVRTVSVQIPSTHAQAQSRATGLQSRLSSHAFPTVRCAPADVTARHRSVPVAAGAFGKAAGQQSGASAFRRWRPGSAVSTAPFGRAGKRASLRLGGRAGFLRPRRCKNACVLRAVRHPLAAPVLGLVRVLQFCFLFLSVYFLSQPRLVSNLRQSSCLSLLGAGITGVRHLGFFFRFSADF